jgi:beta-alanine degradation protein BauB
LAANLVCGILRAIAVLLIRRIPMKFKFFLCALACVFVGVTIAQDVMKVAPDHYKVLFENEHVRVVENTLQPGEKDAPHTHPSGWYYVTEPGSMKITMADGKVTVWEPKMSESGWLKTESLHTSENVGKTPMKFVLVEVKSAPASK